MQFPAGKIHIEMLASPGTSFSVKVWYEVEPLALYRLHPNSITKSGERSGLNAQEYRYVIELNKRFLPEKEKKRITNEAQSQFAGALVRRARRKIEKGNWS